MEEHTIKLGEFMRHFQGFDPGTKIVFGNGSLKFSRVKVRQDKTLQIEFEQPRRIRQIRMYSDKGL